MIALPLYAVLMWELATTAPVVLAKPTGHSTYEQLLTATLQMARTLPDVKSGSSLFHNRDAMLPRHCGDLYRAGQTTSGVYTLFHEAAGRSGQKVYCDMETDGGGWTVIQRRGQYGNHVLYFKRNWEEYARGFGDAAKEYWIGSRALHALTSGAENMTLRVVLTNTTEDSATVDYANVRVDSEDERFKIHVGDFLGPEGWDSLTDCNGMMFSTFDEDNDRHEDDNCAATYRAGWWYSDCYIANLNGVNLNGYYKDNLAGIVWGYREGYDGLYEYSYPSVFIAIRPEDFGNK